MGLFGILKTVSTNEDNDLTKEEKEEVEKGNYEPDEFDRDDDEDSDEDY